MYTSNQKSGMQRDSARDYRQFAGGMPQPQGFQTQGYTPQGTQQTMGPNQMRGPMLAKALQMYPSGPA